MAETDGESSSSDSDDLICAPENPSYPLIHPPFDSPSTESTDPSQPSIHLLNNDCIYIVLSYLDIVDMMKTALVCKRWYNVCLSRMAGLTSIELTPTFSVFRLNKGLTSSNFTSLLLMTEGNLTHLDVSHSSLKLDYVCCRAIGDLCPNLVELNLSKIKIDRKIASYLAKNFPPKLSSLLLNGCVSLKEKCLKQMLMNCKNLEKLDLSYNQKISGKCIAKHMSNNKMKYINFSECNNLKPYTVQFVLANYTDTLEHLDLSFCHWEAFSISTAQLNILKNLKVFNARSSDFEFAEFSRSISNFTSILKLMPNLEVLDLHKNNVVGSNGGDFIIQISNMCPKLKSLNLGFCGLTCSRNLGRGLIDLQFLDTLNIDGLSDTFNYEDLIKAALINCKLLSNLSLQSCFIDDDSIFVLISELKSMKCLDLRSCQSPLDGSFIKNCSAINRDIPLLIYLQDTWLQKDEFLDIPSFLKLRFSILTYNTSGYFDYMSGNEFDDYDDFDDHYDEFDDDFWDNGGYVDEENEFQGIGNYYEVDYAQEEELAGQIDAIEIHEHQENNELNDFNEQQEIDEIQQVQELDDFNEQQEIYEIEQVQDIVVDFNGQLEIDEIQHDGELAVFVDQQGDQELTDLNNREEVYELQDQEFFVFSDLEQEIDDSYYEQEYDFNDDLW